MTLIRKIIRVKAKVGDMIWCNTSIFRGDLDLYITGINEDLIYYSDNKDASIEDSEMAFSEDCTLR